MFIRCAAIVCCSLFIGACTVFPQNETDAIITVDSVKDSINCEIASVLNDPDLKFNKADFRKWNVVADLDLTLVRTLAADAKVGVTAPYTIAVLTATPSLGGSHVDTSIAHVELGSTADEAAKAAAHAKPPCVGSDPSQTQMGLAAWLAANLTTHYGDISGITYTKQFQVVLNAGARFGYSLVPVTNTVALDAGASATRDQTHRLSVAIAPPSSPPKPIPVYTVEHKSVARRAPASVSETMTAPVSRAGARAARDPAIQYLLGRKSPVTLSR
jgi:hypothetical protein